MAMTKYEFCQEVSNKSDLFFLIYTKKIHALEIWRQ